MVGGREDIHTRTVTVLRSLGRLFTRPHDQLALPLDAAPRNATELLARLRALGLSGIDRCRLTRNRAVMVSYRGRELRVHEGYLSAPPEVLAAIVTFVSGRTARLSPTRASSHSRVPDRARSADAATRTRHTRMMRRSRSVSPSGIAASTTATSTARSSPSPCGSRVACARDSVTTCRRRHRASRRRSW